jgi:UDP-3-O-[3-hydroxymyristoyl] glucosamine N-acyltransferase
MSITAGQIAAIIGGTIEGDASVLVYRPSKIEEGGEGTITFLANPKYNEYLYSTTASAVLVSNDLVLECEVKPTLIKVENVYIALAILMEKFNSNLSIPKGQSNMSSVHPSVELGENVSIDDFVVIRSGAKIGANAKIFGQVFIGDNVVIGDDTILYPGVKIYHDCKLGNRCVIHANTVIGSDGFGYAKDENGNFKKIPQTGNVIIEDDVEIGSNAVIDRASMGSTIIKSRAKLDNLIQVAHNVVIGSNTAIAAQAGIAGSVVIGNDCLIGGQAGIAGHLQIADGTMIQAQSGISSSVKGENIKLYGTPALDYANYLKSYAYFKKLPEIVAQLRYVQTEMDKLAKSVDK